MPGRWLRLIGGVLVAVLSATPALALACDLRCAIESCAQGATAAHHAPHRAAAADHDCAVPGMRATDSAAAPHDRDTATEAASLRQATHADLPTSNARPHAGGTSPDDCCQPRQAMDAVVPARTDRISPPIPYAALVPTSHVGIRVQARVRLASAARPPGRVRAPSATTVLRI